MIYKIWYSKFILLLTIVLMVSCQEQVQEKELIKPVRYAVVKHLGEKQSRTFTGLTKSSDITDLSFRLGGVVTNLAVNVGDRVKIGQTIATIDNFEAQNQVNASLAGQRGTQSAVETAQANLKRIRTLYERSNVSLSDYETARNQYESALGQYETAKKSVELAQRQLAYTTLKSPVNGIVNTKNITANEQVSPGQTIVEIQSGNELEAEVGVPENYISSLEVGDPAKIAFPNLNDLVIAGKVSQVSFAAGQSSTFPITIKLDSVNTEIRPGMAVKVSLNISGSNNPDTKLSADVLVVPEDAVKEDPSGKKFVYLIQPEEGKDLGVVKKMYIEIGSITAEGFSIKSGLKSGDFVATAGINSLYNGMKVKLKNAE